MRPSETGGRLKKPAKQVFSDSLAVFAECPFQGQRLHGVPNQFARSFVRADDKRQQVFFAAAVVVGIQAVAQEGDGFAVGAVEG